MFGNQVSGTEDKTTEKKKLKSGQVGMNDTTDLKS